MKYFQLQEAVFNHLWNKHEQDNSFTFSVRQKASKGAERNQFIGTEKSKYFGFTCWDIPVFYPGSASDLTNFIIQVKPERCYLKFQYNMTKAARVKQNKANLAFGSVLLNNLKGAGIPVVTTDEQNKMLYFHVELNKDGYKNAEALIKDFESLYSRIAPVMDSSITAAKRSNPEWQADRYTNAKFDTLIQKMHTRIDKFAAGILSTSDIEEEEEEEASDNEEGAAALHPLNIILYGPPGTGKTYNTINKAVQIINPTFSNDTKTRDEVRKEYERLKAEEQIEFITFHQSMSYEDFIEGIKPKEPKEGDTFLKYEIQPGIFKRIAKRATHIPSIQESRFSLTPEEYAQANFYKISLGNTAIEEDLQIYRYCIDNGYIAIGYGDAINFAGKTEGEINGMKSILSREYAAKAINYFIHYLKVGDYVIASKGNSYFRAIGKVTGEYEYKDVEGLEVHQFRKVLWLLKDVNIPVEELYNNQFTQQTIYKLNKDGIKQDFFVKNAVPVQQEGIVKKNYVLIIDEINRGNVSQIFGELITLIEEDKRQGNKEALEVVLPYSKEKFAVPANLYIIGTMNTADRSVEALDTALRRRFVFEEMMPKPELLSPYGQLKELWSQHWTMPSAAFEKLIPAFEKLFGVTINLEAHRNLEEVHRETPVEQWEGVDAAAVFKEVITEDPEYVNTYKLLSAINNRLEVLLDKDHTIGHAWLMGISDLPTLQIAFKNKILPLLQEYFYNNYAKIGLVLGNAFVTQKQVNTKLFARFTDSEEITNDYKGNTIYTLVDPFTLDAAAFKSIYE